MNPMMSPSHSQNSVWSLRFWGWLLLSAVVIGLDQWSKAAVIQHFALFEKLTLTPFFDLLRHHNAGAAFSFLGDASGWQRWFFTAIATIASGVIVTLLHRHRNHKLLAFALSMILGGALGNLIDRLQHGFVVDFLHFHWGLHSFPVFNLADSAITLGAGLLIFEELLKFWGPKPKASS
jgi:signal peptidase II